MTFEDATGALCSVPVNWTDLLPAEPYLSIGRGRSRFRMADLHALADLVADLTAAQNAKG